MEDFEGVQKNETTAEGVVSRRFIIQTIIATGIATISTGIYQSFKLPSISGPRNPIGEHLSHGVNQNSPIFNLMKKHFSGLSITAGANNIRNPPAFNEKGELIGHGVTQATQDIAQILFDLFRHRRIISSNDALPINRLQPSISVGGPVASLAYRRFLGWEIYQVRPNENKFGFKNSNTIALDERLGVFQDLSKDSVEIGERTYFKGGRPWIMRGRIFDIYDHTEIDHAKFTDATFLTYLHDTGQGNPHLNIAGIRAPGTWGASYLLSRYFEDTGLHGGTSEKLNEVIESKL